MTQWLRFYNGVFFESRSQAFVLSFVNNAFINVKPQYRIHGLTVGDSKGIDH